jgi:hypothetical protein
LAEAVAVAAGGDSPELALRRGGRATADDVVAATAVTGAFACTTGTGHDAVAVAATAVIELPAEIVGLFAEAVAEALTPAMIDPAEIEGAAAAAELVVAATAETFALTGASLTTIM